MTVSKKSDPVRLGFLTVVELPQQGYVGGLLITNHQGRPLEFQCTTPVKPNRTQEILYGPTLVPFLLTELIGQTLLDRVSVKPQLVLVERTDMLDLRLLVDIPVAAFLKSEDRNTFPTAQIQPHRNHSLLLHASHAEDAQEIEDRLSLLPKEAEITEPFDRIRDALEETLKVKVAG